MTEPELKRFAVLADLSEDERSLVSDLLESRDLSDGETLFLEGDEADALVLILSGRLRLSSRHCEATGELQAGASLGALSLVQVGSREVEAVSVGASEVRVLRREDFRRLVDDDARIACRIVESILADVAVQARAALEVLGSITD